VDDFITLGGDYIAHSGVLGMHWGVRKEESDSREGRSKIPTRKSGDEVLKVVGANAQTPQYLADRYGPGTLSGKSDPTHGLSDKQKKILAGVGIGAALVATGVTAAILLKQGKIGALANVVKVAEKEGMSVKQTAQLESAYKAFITRSDATKNTQAMGWTKDFFSNLPTDTVHIKSGSILKRVSTDVEQEIHPLGFFAAHTEADVTRYKAVLPQYWDNSIFSQGSSKTGGFVVKLKAMEDVKAPSVKESVDIFKSILQRKIPFHDYDPNTYKLTAQIDSIENYIRKSNANFGNTLPEDADDFIRTVFPNFSVNWINKEPGIDPISDLYFAEVKKRGYNALIDINDAGSIGDTPLRVLDGTLFEHAGADVLTPADIQAARELITHLIAHSEMESMTDLMIEGGDYLSHFGILGMHWGKRKVRPTNPRVGGVNTQNQGQPSTGKSRSVVRVSGNSTQKDSHVGRNAAIAFGIAVAANVGIRLGTRYILKNPQVINQTINKIKGTKALTVGYQTIRMNLKNGRYVRA